MVSLLDKERAFLSKIRSFSARHGMFSPGMKIVVGVSGGADSVGLLQVLRQLAPEYGLQLHVVHLNHMLRPEAADDAAFVRQLAHHLGLPATIGCARVGAIARRLRTGTEDAGRLARYWLLETVADRIGAQRIALGHHAGDQVETVLCNIMRGAGPGGLAGIPPRRGRVVRPLLCASKEEIAAYCRAAGLEWRTDASNLSPEFLRNRIRHRLLPLLQKEFNPRLDQAILRLAEIVGEENRWFRRCTQSLLGQLLLDGRDARRSAQRAPGADECSRAPGPATVAPASDGARPPSGKVRLALPAFLRLPLALRRCLLRAAVRRAGGNLRHLGYQNVEDCLDFLCRGAPGGAVQLPSGVRVSKGSTCFTVAVVNRSQRQEVRGRKKLETEAARKPEGVTENIPTSDLLHPASVLLPVPGRAPLPGLGLVIRAQVVDIIPGAAGAERLWETGAGNRACFDYDQLESPLAVRTRRAGDHLRPFGMQGAKKLKKLLGELRVPARLRDRVALVVSGGEIIWVAGYRRAETAPVTEQTRRMLILEAEKLS